MIYSRRALLWIAIQFGPWVEAANPALQTRVFLNSSTSALASNGGTGGNAGSGNTPTTQTRPPLVIETNSQSTVYFISYTRPRVTPWPSVPIDDNDPKPDETSGAQYTSSIPSKWTNSSAPYPTKSGPFTDSPGRPLPSESWSLNSSATWYGDATATDYKDCTTLAPGEPATSWSIVPNTTIVTVTVFPNETTSFSTTPEFTPPTYCPDSTTSTGIPFYATPAHTTTPKESTESAIVSSSTLLPFFSFSAAPTTRETVTVITTSKNPITVTTVATVPTFPGDVRTEKETVNPATYTDTHKWTPFPNPPPQTNPPLPMTTIFNGDRSATTRITQIVDGITVIVSPSQAVIGGQVVNIGGGPKTITEGGDVFTVSPDQVEGPFFIILNPTYTGDGGGGVFQEQPKPTTVKGVSVSVGPTQAVVDGSSFAINPGSPPRTIVVKGQTVSIGPGGVGFSGTTITPPPSLPTNVVIVDGEAFSAIGSSIAVIKGTTFTYGPGIAPQTVVLNGEVITVGPSGIVFDGTTIGGTAHPTGTQFGIAGGLSISEIGSTLAVINGQTITVGPGATPLTTVIGGHTITVGPNGLVMGGATLTFPFNPITQAVTAGGITFSQVGSSLVVIGDKTYTIGPGAPQTTDIYNGQTISIGPGGVGFATTTFTAMTSTPTETTSAKSTGKGKKNGAGRLRPVYGVLGTCIAICIGCFV